MTWNRLSEYLPVIRAALVVQAWPKVDEHSGPGHIEAQIEFTQVSILLPDLA